MILDPSTGALAAFIVALIIIVIAQWRLRPDTALVDSQNRALQDRDNEIRMLKSERAITLDETRQRESEMQSQIDVLHAELGKLKSQLIQAEARIAILEQQIRAGGGRPLTDAL
jgi:septal ring factor EnvC (AmiA/AmiB activator)